MLFEEKHHMLWAYEAYEAEFSGERGERLPPPAGGPPPSEREVLGFRRSKPAALPSIGYRGFAVAPMTLRAPLRGTAVQPLQ